jgi:alkylation response protein AidB-like acyl-CoA dehydrogenase
MLIKKVDAEIVKANIRNSIEKQCLTEEQLTLAYREKWFKIWVPQQLGGKELTLVEGVKFLEDLAYLDGSLGWTITLCAGANLFVGYIERQIGQELFSEQTVCFGGSGMPNGQAVAKEGGYLVSGQWKYATGSPHLTHFTANVNLFDSGGAVLDEDGKQAYITIFVYRNEVTVVKDWYTFGLESTASHSFVLDDIFVPENQVYILSAERVTREEVLYTYPFIPFAEVTLLANYMGMFSRFLDLVRDVVDKKALSTNWKNIYGNYLTGLLTDVTADFQEMRQAVYTDILLSWDNLLEEQDNTDVYMRIAENSRSMVSFLEKKVVMLYPFCGIAAAQRDQELNIVFRNIFTATQHSLLLSKEDPL